MRRDDLTRYHGATVVSYASCNSEFAKACHTTSLFIKLQRTKTGNYTITLGCRVAHHARCAALGISPGDWEAISPISVIVMDHGTMARLKISVLKNIEKHQEFWFFVVKFPICFLGRSFWIIPRGLMLRVLRHFDSHGGGHLQGPQVATHRLGLVDCPGSPTEVSGFGWKCFV